jgi:hypothetical protein
VPALPFSPIHAVPHLEVGVRQAGFPLDHPYVEHVCASVIGPTAVLLLRRLLVLWHEREPAVQASELSRSLGLGANTQYRDCRFWRTADRLVKFGFASCATEDVIEAYATVRPLTPHQLERLPRPGPGTPTIVGCWGTTSTSSPQRPRGPTAWRPSQLTT